MKKTLLIKMIVVLLSISTNLSSQTWNEVMKTAATDRAEGEFYGWSVSISGHLAIVGAHNDGEDANGENTLFKAGSAYILEKDNEGYWNLVQKIVASDRAGNDDFGYSVGISGNYAIVGARYQDSDANGGAPISNAGAAYFFERDNEGNWNQKQKIVHSDRDYGDQFGNSVSISGDYILVGAQEKGTPALGDAREAGAAYIFQIDDQGIWNEIQKLVGDNIPNENFGNAVSISGEYAIIGAKDNGGVAFFFEREISGTWTRVNKLLGPSYTGYQEGSVSISGNYAIAGTAYDHYDVNDNDSLYFAGSAFVFERNSSGTWEMVQKIVPSDRAKMDQFGASVAISGNKAIVGAPLKDLLIGQDFYSWAGAAYVFNRSGNGVWEEDTKLLASDYDLGTGFGVFGWAVALSGNYNIVGSYSDAEDHTGENPLYEAGSAYVFSYCGTVEKNNPLAICMGDSVLLGGEYRLASGTFYDTVRASTGCDSIIISQLTVNEVDTEITTTETTLTAQASTGSYQWLDCSTNAEIMGETNQSFTPASSGNYAAELTQNGCKDTSICYAFNMVGIEEMNLEYSVRVYPTPANKLLNIELDEVYEFVDVRILNLLGKEVIYKRFEGEQLLKVNISELPSGPYFIQLQTPKGKASIRVIKNE